MKGRKRRADLRSSALSDCQDQTCRVETHQVFSGAGGASGPCYFACVVDPGVSLARGSLTSEPVIPAERRRRLRRKRILFCLLLVGLGFCRLGWLLRRGVCARISPAKQDHKKRSLRVNGRPSMYSIHRLSSQGLFSSMFCMMRISARCPLSTSVAKLNNSGVLSCARGVEQFLHHCQSAVVVLNHAFQKQIVELRLCFPSASICSAVSIPGISIFDPCDMLWCMSGIAGETGCPRETSHRFMNFISSDCDLLIRAPSDLTSLFSVCDSISAGHNCLSDGAQSYACMNCTSAGETGGRVALVVLGRVRVGFPGAPGWTTTGVDGAVCWRADA